MCNQEIRMRSLKGSGKRTKAVKEGIRKRKPQKLGDCLLTVSL